MEQSQAATALLTEHLEYTPLSLIDDIIDSVNNFVYQGVGSLETGLFATPPERLGFKNALKDNGGNVQTDGEYPDAKQEIEEGLHKLETLLSSTVDKNFDKFEIYVLRNILAIPQELVNWVRLNHYEGIDFPLPGDAPTVATIELLRRKLVASRKINKGLQTEQRRNEAMLVQLRAMAGSIQETSTQPKFSFLSNSAAIQAFGNQSLTPLATNTTFALSQLPAMKAVLGDLRGQLAMLKQLPITAGTAKDEIREERREYIEKRTQSLIQRRGQVMDGDTGVSTGKVADPLEIEALEKVAAIFDQT